MALVTQTQPPALRRRALQARPPGASITRLSKLGLLLDAQVVDVGCGDGAFGLVAAPMPRFVTGVDTSTRAIQTFLTRAACQGIPARAVLASAGGLPLASGVYDLVVSRLTLHQCVDPARAVAEMLRVLRPGGQLVIADLAGYAEPPAEAFDQSLQILADQSHQRALPLAALSVLCSGLGARILEADIIDEEWVGGLMLGEWLDQKATPAHRRRDVQTLLDTAPASTLVRLGITAIEGHWCLPIRLTFLRVAK